MPATVERLSAKETRKHAGQWVAVRDGKVVVSAFTPNEVADWLRKNDVSADIVYRVPAEGEPSVCFY